MHDVKRRVSLGAQRHLFRHVTLRVQRVGREHVPCGHRRAELHGLDAVEPLVDAMGGEQGGNVEDDDGPAANRRVVHEIHGGTGEMRVLVTLLFVQIAERKTDGLTTDLVADGGLDGRRAVLVRARDVDVDDVEALGVELDLGVEESTSEAEGGLPNLWQAKKIRRGDVSVDEDSLASDATPKKGSRYSIDDVRHEKMKNTPRPVFFIRVLYSFTRSLAR